MKGSSRAIQAASNRWLRLPLFLGLERDCLSPRPAVSTWQSLSVALGQQKFSNILFKRRMGEVGVASASRLCMSHNFRAGHSGCRNAAAAASFRPCKGQVIQPRARERVTAITRERRPGSGKLNGCPSPPRARPERAKGLPQRGGEGIGGSGGKSKASGYASTPCFQ